MMTIDAAKDRRFAMFIKERDGFTCQNCGAVFEPNASALHCAHMFGRWKPATRYDDDNACALCAWCHLQMDTHPDDKRAFFERRLGETRYLQLQARSNT